MTAPETTHPTPNRHTLPYATAAGPCSQGGWQGDDRQEMDNGDGERTIGDQGRGEQCQHYNQHPAPLTDDPAPATSPASHCSQGGLRVLAGDDERPTPTLTADPTGNGDEPHKDQDHTTTSTDTPPTTMNGASTSTSTQQ